jgi:ectoine hydroxylase-related dioxygenase (phytanoyl-CoA dioxygenase family)
MSIFEDASLPTAADVRAYHEHGWLLTTLVVKDEYLESCRRAVEEVYEAVYDRVYPWSGSKENTNFGKPYLDRTQPRLDAYLSLHKRHVAAIARAPELAAYASVLMDAAEVRLYRDVLLTMPSRQADATGWHVDKNYWPTCSSARLTTAWLSLDDCGVENGCLVVVNGSHRWKRTTFVTKIPLDDIGRIEKLYAKSRDEIEIISVPHRRGQVSLHSCLLIHGAHPNVSSVTRQSLAIVLQDESNHYVAAGSASGRAPVNFNTNDRVGPKLADGTPDYRDPEFYPLLYRNGASRERTADAACQASS